MRVSERYVAFLLTCATLLICREAVVQAEEDSSLAFVDTFRYQSCLETPSDCTWMEVGHTTGTIPTEIGLLTELTVLSLTAEECTTGVGCTRMSGTIPTEIGLLTKLDSISLYGTKSTRGKLNGPIPTEFGLLTDLTEMYLMYNELSGTIPTEFGLLTKLTLLWLDGNNLTDPIPYHHLTHLKYVDLGENIGLCDEPPSDFTANFFSPEWRERTWERNACASVPSDSDNGTGPGNNGTGTGPEIDTTATSDARSSQMDMTTFAIMALVAVIPLAAVV